MAIRNWTAPAPQGGSRAARRPEGLRAKLPQANRVVAKRTSQGTSAAKTLDGVANKITPPIAPPTMLIAKSAFSDRPSKPEALARLVYPVTSWAGNSATVDVILAARASIPAAISAGKVMNEPPPAKAFCAPAQIDATKSTHKISIMHDLPYIMLEPSAR